MSKQLLFKNEWLSTMLYNGWYVATEETRCRNTLVCVLPYRRVSNKFEFLLRYEHNPAHESEDSDMKEYVPSAITGGCEKYNPKQHAVEELAEEGGYHMRAERMIFLGTCRPLKSSSCTMHIYAVSISALDVQTNASGDGTPGETGAWPDWVDEEELLRCKDPYIHTALLRLKYYLSMRPYERDQNGLVNW
jgi:hypothetical protein